MNCQKRKRGRKNIEKKGVIGFHPIVCGVGVIEEKKGGGKKDRRN